MRALELAGPAFHDVVDLLVGTPASVLDTSGEPLGSAVNPRGLLAVAEDALRTGDWDVAPDVDSLGVDAHLYLQAEDPLLSRIEAQRALRRTSPDAIDLDALRLGVSCADQSTALMARFALAGELLSGDPVQATQHFSQVLRSELGLIGLAQASGMPVTALHERCLTALRDLHSGLKGKVPLKEAGLWAAWRLSAPNQAAK